MNAVSDLGMKRMKIGSVLNTAPAEQSNQTLVILGPFPDKHSPFGHVCQIRVLTVVS